MWGLPRCSVVIVFLMCMQLHAAGESPPKSRDEFATDAATPVPAAQLGSPAMSPARTTAVETMPVETTSTLPFPVECLPTSLSGPTFKLRGRLEADAIFATQDRKDKALYADFANAVGFRRARLGAAGDVNEQVHWVAEFDFAGGNIAFADAYVA